MTTLELIYDFPTLWHNVCDMLSCDSAHPLMPTSGVFWVLFMLFLPIYAMVKHRKAMMMVFVIAFGLFMSYKSSGVLTLFLLLTTTVDWQLARLIHNGKPSLRKILLWLSLCLSVSVLGFFKYGNFVLFNWHALVGGNFQPMDLVLPLGISFYTFKSISYVVDVYKGKLEPTSSWLEYAFYLTFFPSLIAGPITRATSFLPQIKENRPATKPEIYQGLWQVLVGVIKKAVIADYFAQYTNIVFGLAAGEGVPLLLAAIVFSWQLYCDFSGYSDIAIGLGRIMGYDLGVNFNFPYRSLNVTDLWRRWHITLSTWLRDYIYIPLGGNRRGKMRQYANLFITMLIGGLWHGAAWTFVIWGALHGAALCMHKALQPSLKKITNTAVVKVVAILITFIFWTFTLIFFRADSLHDVGTILHDIGANWEFSQFVAIVTQRKLLCILLIIITAAHYLPQKLYVKAEKFFVNSPWVIKLLIFVLVVQVVTAFATEEVQPFIYNKF